MSEFKEFDAIFEAALGLLAPAHQRLERVRQRIALLRPEERHLTRTLVAREKAIERARQALRVAAEEDERVLAATEAELQALDPAREQAAAPDGRMGEPEPALVGVEG
jgi:hypothetical protein